MNTISPVRNRRVHALAALVAGCVGVVVWRRLLVPDLQDGLELVLDAALVASVVASLLFWWFRGLRVVGREERAPVRRRTRAALWVWIALLGVGGMVLTSLVVHFEDRQITNEARARFERHSERLAAELVPRVTMPVYGLNGARAAFAANGTLDRTFFGAYVAARDLPKEFPGVLGFGFVKCVEPDGLDAFIARERADGAPDFSVRRGEWADPHSPAHRVTGKQDDRLFVVTYLEPLEPNRAAWGLDVGGDAQRRASIERAVSSGQATITGRITLVQDDGNGAGFGYMVPLYRPGAPVTTPAERWAALEGLVMAPVLVDKALEGIEQIADGQLDFELFDGRETSAETQMFDFHRHLGRTRGAVGDDAYADRLFHSRRVIDIADREWTLVTSSTPAFEASIDRRPVAVAALGGTVLTALLMAFAWSLGTSRERAFRLAEAMTAELSAAKASADRLAEIARRTSNAVIITDRQGLVEWVNEGFTRISGYTLEEVRGRKPGDLLQGPKSDPAAARAMGEAVRAVKPAKVEIVNYAKGGAEYRLSIEIVPLRDAEGVHTGFMAIESDITEQHAAREAAEAANRAKSAFLANMSHEIRTPLTAILGFADVLREDGNLDAAPEHRLATIDTIRRAGNHLLTVINDMLDLSKIEANKMTVERVDTSLVKIVRDVESMMRPRAAAKGVTLTTVLGTPVPDRILSDPTRLRQMLINLVGNAVKFTDQGSVTVRVEVESGPSGPRLLIDVEDTGPGMTQEQASRLFQVFGQADDTVTRRFGGTGLGLTICRRLSSLMNGSVVLLRTEPGVGSCFRLELPLEAVPGATMVADLDAVADAPAAPQHVGVLNGRILLAEDGIDNQRLIAFHLKKAGATVTVADNGRIALEKIDAAIAAGEPFDLLVSDMQMPEMDGYTLARRLRQRGMTLPIVALTAHAMAEDRARCMEAGCDDYATKPIDKGALLAACGRWLAKTNAASASGVLAEPTQGPRRS